MQLKVILNKKLHYKKIIIKISGKLGRLLSKTLERKKVGKESKNLQKFPIEVSNEERTK